MVVRAEEEAACARGAAGDRVRPPARRPRAHYPVTAATAVTAVTAPAPEE